MIITEEFIHQNKSVNGGWNFSQISMLGETWPPIKGWISRAIGREISDEDAEKFVEYGKQRPTKQQLKVIKSSAKERALPKRPIFKSDFGSTDSFLRSFEWKVVRMKALSKYGARCQCCGADKTDNVKICVDHIKPRKLYPQLALDINNLQVLCEVCNHGKGNWDMTDWKPGDAKATASEQ